MSPKHKKVSEPVARSGRTVAQGGPAWAVAEFVDAFLYNMTDRQYGALVVLLTVVFAAGLAAYENYAGKGFLREVPPKEVAVVDKDENGVFEANTIWVVLGIIGIVLLVLLIAGALPGLGR